MKNLREKIRSRTPVVGTFAALPHPMAVEIVARGGFDCLCIDWEHTQLGRERLEDMLRAADCRATPAIVRLPGHDPEAISAALDAGAAGILAPHVSTVEEALAIARAARFPPHGTRGAGPGRAAGYGYGVFDYVARANEEIVVAVQIETAQGLENIAAIAALDEIDLLFIGPGDLALSIGALGDGGAERLDAAMETIIDHCGNAGRAVGLFRPSADDLPRWVSRGASFFLISSDAMLMGAAATATADAAARALGRRK
nr:aldolase/citrate lyase family protein [Nitratireductor soli]